MQTLGQDCQLNCKSRGGRNASSRLCFVFSKIPPSNPRLECQASGLLCISRCKCTTGPTVLAETWRSRWTSKATWKDTNDKILDTKKFSEWRVLECRYKDQGRGKGKRDRKDWKRERGSREIELRILGPKDVQALRDVRFEHQSLL